MRCNELVTIYNDQLKKEEHIALHLALIEKQKLIADKELALENLAQEISDLQRHLQEKLAKTAFTSVQEVSDLLRTIAQQADLEHSKAALEQHIEVLNRTLADNQKQLATDLAPARAIQSHNECLCAPRVVLAVPHRIENIHRQVP